MKKVALITFHMSLNYGANLQTYATYRILRELGYEVGLIDIRIEEPLTLLQKIITFPKKMRFNRFRRKFYPPFTRRYHSMEELRHDPPGADIYLAGSDQTWNTHLTKRFADAFYLDFGPRETPRIGFSVSFGNDDWHPVDDTTAGHLRRCVSRFRALSVREAGGVDICLREFGVRAFNSLDPSLLCDRYPELTGELTPRHNIVSYMLAPNERYYSCVNILSSRLNKPIELLGTLRPVKGYKYKYAQGVDAWIRKIAESDLVFTDSFHGVVVSILYRRNFVAFIGNPKRIGRIRTLLSHLGLTERLWSRPDYDAEKIADLACKPIDYDRVIPRLDRLRQESVSFLRSALKL